MTISRPGWDISKHFLARQLPTKVKIITTTHMRTHSLVPLFILAKVSKRIGQVIYSYTVGYCIGTFDNPKDKNIERKPKPVIANPKARRLESKSTPLIANPNSETKAAQAYRNFQQVLNQKYKEAAQINHCQTQSKIFNHDG